MKKFTKKDFEFLPIIAAIISSQKIALKYFKKDKNFELKTDSSPLTKADTEINQHLITALKKNYPDIAIISEENSFKDNVGAILQDQAFIIDPLDGTSSFIKGSPEFTVNIALKIKDKLVMGAIYFPVEDVLYYAENNLLFKFEQASKTKTKITKISPRTFYDKSKITIIATRREDELREIKKALSKTELKCDFVSFSSSAKFCYLTEGVADVYYRAAKIKLWDVAAGFAICQSAGLEIIDHQNNDLLQIILNRNYVKNLEENQFRIEPFIIKPSALNLS